MNLVKRVIILFFGFFWIPNLVFTYDQHCQIANSKKWLRLSPKCEKDIKRIKEDYLKLNDFFEEKFKRLNKEKLEKSKPSDLLIFFTKEVVDKDINLEYQRASSYLHGLEPYYPEFDRAFQVQLVETKNIKKSWKWFDTYFKEQGLKKPFAFLVKQVIEKDIID